MITGEEAWLWPVRERYILLDGLISGEPSYKQVLVVGQRGVVVYTATRREIEDSEIDSRLIRERRRKHLEPVDTNYNITPRRFRQLSSATFLGRLPAVTPIAGTVLELPDCGKRHTCRDESYVCVDIPEDCDPKFYDYYVNPQPLCPFEYGGRPDEELCPVAVFASNPRLWLEMGWAVARVYRGRRFIIPTIGVGVRS